MRRSEIESLLRQAMGQISLAEESVKKTEGMVRKRPFIKMCEYAKEDINAALALLKDVRHEGSEVHHSNH